MHIEFVLELTGQDKITLSLKKRRGGNNSPLADSQDICEHMKRKKKSSILQIEMPISARAKHIICLRLRCPSTYITLP